MFDPDEFAASQEARRVAARIIEVSRDPDAPARLAGSGRESVSFGLSSFTGDEPRTDDDGNTVMPMIWDLDEWNTSDWM